MSTGPDFGPFIEDDLEAWWEQWQAERDNRPGWRKVETVDGLLDQVQYFGPPERRKHGEVQIPTPVGTECVLCQELVVDGDMGTVNSVGQTLHYECILRAVVGSVAHQQGRCSCFGGSGDEEETDCPDCNHPRSIHNPVHGCAAGLGDRRCSCRSDRKMTAREEALAAARYFEEHR